MSDDNKDYDGIKYRPETKSPAVFRLLLGVLDSWGIGFMGYYPVSGWSSTGEFAEKQKAKQDRLAAVKAKGAENQVHKEVGKEESVAAGKKEFAARCAACHGAEAKGGIGPDLTRKEYKYGRSEQVVAQTISEGRPGGMPSFKNDVSHEKLESLVNFLLSL